MATKDITDRQVCEAVRDYHLQIKEAGEPYGKLIGLKWPYELLAQRTGEPEKVCYRAMERAEERGLIDYGVSLRTGWLSEKGEELLAAPGGEPTPNPGCEYCAGTGYYGDIGHGGKVIREYQPCDMCNAAPGGEGKSE